MLSGYIPMLSAVYADDGMNEIVETQISFQKEMSQYSAGMFEFFLLLFKLVASVAVVVLIGYGMYWLMAKFFDRFNK